MPLISARKTTTRQAISPSVSRSRETATTVKALAGLVVHVDEPIPPRFASVDSLHSRPTFGGQACALMFVGQQPGDRLSELARIAGRDQEAALSVCKHLWDAADARRYDRAAGGHRLGPDDSQRFL